LTLQKSNNNPAMLAQTVQDHESCLRFSVRLSAIFREILCNFVSFYTWPNPFGTQILKNRPVSIAQTVHNRFWPEYRLIPVWIV